MQSLLTRVQYNILAQ